MSGLEAGAKHRLLRVEPRAVLFPMAAFPTCRVPDGKDKGRGVSKYRTAKTRRGFEVPDGKEPRELEQQPHLSSMITMLSVPSYNNVRPNPFMIVHNQWQTIAGS